VAILFEFFYSCGQEAQLSLR